MKSLLALLLGIAFGWLLIASQAMSWYRIQEMFHFESFHMFGLLGSAIFTGAVISFLLKKKSNEPEKILPPKPLQIKRNIIGGLLFGLGWGLTGACTAPIFIQIGVYPLVGILIFAGAMIGTGIFFILYKQK